MDKKIEKKKWTSKKILLILSVSVFISTILFYLIWGDHSSKFNVDTERISISSVEFGPFQDFIPVTGTVQPIETFFLDVAEGGRVVEKFAEQGAFLEVGDPIIRLENPSVALSIMYSEANVFSTMNSLRMARLSMEQNRLNLQMQILNIEYQIRKEKRSFQNNKKLYEKQLISQIEFEDSRDNYQYLLNSRNLTLENNRKDSLFRIIQIEDLEQNVSRMQKQLEMTSAQMENLTVKAPIKGQLTSLNTEIGQSISKGENLGQIDNIDKYRVRVPVDQHYIARVVNGQKGTFTFDNKTYTLEIKTVFPEVSSGRFEIDMIFDGEQPTGLRRGQTLHIRLELSAPEEVLFVEMGGFYQTTGGQWIFVLDEDEKSAIRRKISLGRSNTRDVEILEGLKKGEKVITSSYDTYREVEKLILN
ncbi:MAG: efflux RND transporter periplasmic adaptor subunit [Melioribacteraceae bacterium]|jgi:HlyD family secretion protein|nr:efflux RND transporter periplasmic adaptor subunit [Melioribacteraceae bacterium]